MDASTSARRPPCPPMPARRSPAPRSSISSTSPRRTAASRRWAVSPSTSTKARFSPSSARTAPASPRSSASPRVASCPTTEPSRSQGDRLLSHGPAEAMKAGIRLVPQEFLVCPDMSVLDNVLLGQRPTQLGIFLDRRAARREVKRRLDRLGVGGIDLDTPVGDLSVVQRTFVQIARGLSPGAKVMLIDEPTAPMDDAEVVQFLSVLKALTREGMGIVYISHRLKEIFQLAEPDQRPARRQARRGALRRRDDLPARDLGDGRREVAQGARHHGRRPTGRSGSASRTSTRRASATSRSSSMVARSLSSTGSADPAARRSVRRSSARCRARGRSRSMAVGRVRRSPTASPRVWATCRPSGGPRAST